MCVVCMHMFNCVEYGCACVSDVSICVMCMTFMVCVCVCSMRKMCACLCMCACVCVCSVFSVNVCDSGAYFQCWVGTDS